MELYVKIFDVLFPVFFVIGVGYYLGKKDPKFDTKFITNFAGNIGTPAMIFYTITTTGVTLSVFIEYFIYALIINPKSPKGEASIIEKDLEWNVSYSRPSKKNRLIFGEKKDNALVPYNEYWRLGANVATELSLNKSI